MFTLPALPYAQDRLDPVISAKTLDFHYTKHHQGYVTTLNALLADTTLTQDPTLAAAISGTPSLEEVIRWAHQHRANTLKAKAIFNNAAQIWAHAFYWHSLAPESQRIPAQDPQLIQAIDRDFGGLHALEAALHDAGTGQFGSGWVWLGLAPDGKLSVQATANAELIWINSDLIPLAILDVWEHAYYLDYQNRRSEHLKTIVSRLLNWQFIQHNFTQKRLFTLGSGL